MLKLFTPSWSLALLVAVQLLLLAPVRAQFFQNFFGGNAGGFAQREQEPPPVSTHSGSLSL